MAGGGVNERNIARILAETGVRELHFTAMVSADSPAVYRNPVPLMGGTLHKSEYQRSSTSADLVGRMMSAAG